MPGNIQAGHPQESAPLWQRSRTDRNSQAPRAVHTPLHRVRAAGPNHPYQFAADTPSLAGRVNRDKGQAIPTAKLAVDGDWGKCDMPNDLSIDYGHQRNGERSNSTQLIDQQMLGLIAVGVVLEGGCNCPPDSVEVRRGFRVDFDCGQDDGPSDERSTDHGLQQDRSGPHLIGTGGR